MDEAKGELVQSWLTKAQIDLAAARKLRAGSDPCSSAAAFHCQQAAEKAIKGFLVFHDRRFGKTHDLRLLTTRASAINAAFASWRQRPDRLIALRSTVSLPRRQA